MNAPASQNLYPYVPELGFNLFGAVAYLVLFVVHAAWFVKYPETRWIEAHMLAFAGYKADAEACEMPVYILRSLSYNAPLKGSYWVGQYVLGMFAPSFLIIAMLMALFKAYKSTGDGRVAIFGGPKLIPMRSQAVIGLLILIGSLFTGNNRTVVTIVYSGDAGKYVLQASRGVQILILTTIQGLLTGTLISIRRNQLSASPTHPPIPDPRISRTLLILLFLTVGMVWVRSIFRLAESLEGWEGYAAVAEFNYGFFEFATVWVAGTVWTVWPFAWECDGREGTMIEEVDGSVQGKAGSSETHLVV